MIATETRFDLAGAVRAAALSPLADPAEGLRGAEARASRELGERFDPQMRRNPRGFWAPLDALVPATQKRALTTSNGAGAVVTRYARMNDFTDLLRRKAVLGLMGVEFASLWGGDSPVAIPKKSTGATAGWVAEGSSLAESTPVFDADADSVPKTLGAAVTVTRKMWLESGNDELRDYLVAELGAAMAAEVDRAGLVGAGGVEPTGLFNLAGIPTASIGANGGPPTRAHLVGALKAVHAANGDSPATARMGWATTPDVEARLRLTDGGMGDGPLWGDDDRILGKPAAATTAVPNNLAKGSGTGLSALAYGNWGDVLVDHAPAAFVLVNPHSLAGNYRVTAWLEVRILFRHVESFVVFKDVQTAP